MQNPQMCIIHRVSVLYCLAKHLLKKTDPSLCPICSSMYE